MACDGSGGAPPGPIDPLRVIWRDCSVDMFNERAGEPATSRSTPEIISLAISSVESASAPCPDPSAIAFAAAAVFPHIDSYTTTAFIIIPFLINTVFSEIYQISFADSPLSQNFFQLNKSWMM
jgi:hypothetical protein